MSLPPQNSANLASDYIFREGESFFDSKEDKQTRAFLEGRLAPGELTALEVAKEQSITILAGFAETNRLAEARNRAAMLSNEKIGREQLATLHEIESQAKKGNSLKERNNDLAEIRNELQDRNNELTEETNEILQDGFGQLEDSISKLGAIFSWNCLKISLELGSMGQSLEQLVSLASNPSKTWALEQFVDARNLFDRKLLPEALRCVNFAIDGHVGNAGNPYDPRFHFLKGLILIEPPVAGEMAVADLVRARNSFLLCAKYANDTFPTVADGFWCAAQTAYFEGEFKLGLELCGKALDSNERHLQTLILAGRLAARLGKIEDSSIFIERCLRTSPALLRVVVSNDDLLLPVNIVEIALSRLMPEALIVAQGLGEIIKDQTSQFIAGSTCQVSHAEFCPEVCSKLQNEAGEEIDPELKYPELREFILSLISLRYCHATQIQAARLQLGTCVQLCTGIHLTSYKKTMTSPYQRPLTVKRIPSFIAIASFFFGAAYFAIPPYLHQRATEFREGTFSGWFYTFSGLIVVAIILIPVILVAIFIRYLEVTFLTKPLAEAKFNRRMRELDDARATERKRLDQIAMSWGLENFQGFMAHLERNSEAWRQYKFNFDSRKVTQFTDDFAPYRLGINEISLGDLRCLPSRINEISGVRKYISVS